MEFRKISVKLNLMMVFCAVISDRTETIKFITLREPDLIRRGLKPRCEPRFLSGAISAFRPLESPGYFKHIHISVHAHLVINLPALKRSLGLNLKRTKAQNSSN